MIAARFYDILIKNTTFHQGNTTTTQTIQKRLQEERLMKRKTVKSEG